jgi:hypothetical protein
VSDAGRGLEFYLERLWFRAVFRLGDKVNYAIVERDAVSVHLIPASLEGRALGRLSL